MIFCVHSFLDLRRKIFAEFDNGKSTTIEDPAVVKKTQAIENPTLIKNDLTGTFYNAEILWIKLVEEIAKKKNPGIIIEVGMWSLLQCRQAAGAGLEAHCIEPSPRNFKGIQRRYNGLDADLKKRIHLYNVAAGSESGTVPFLSDGSTG